MDAVKVIAPVRIPGLTDNDKDAPEGTPSRKHRAMQDPDLSRGVIPARGDSSK